MTIDALSGGTALTGTLAGLTGSVREIARAQPTEPVKKEKTPAEQPIEKTDQAPEERQAADPIPAAEIARALAREFQEDANTRLSILYDQDIDLFISRRVDPESGEVLRQFPYEEHLERIRLFAERNRDGAEHSLDLSI